MKKILYAILVSVIFNCGLIGTTMAETVTKPNTFTEGTPALATEVNENFDTIYDQVNKVGAEIHIDSTNHFVGIGTTTPAATLDVNGDINGTGILEMSVESTVSRIFSTSYGDNTPHNGVFIGRRARGTRVSPSPVLADDRLAIFGGTGYDSSGWLIGSGYHMGSMRILAAENWDGTGGQGTYISFVTTPIGETTAKEQVWITDSGDVQVKNGDIQVENGYLQIAQTAGLPPAADCTGSDTTQYGRMKIDATNIILYICTSGGWWGWPGAPK